MSLDLDARPDVIHRDNVARLKTKLVPQAANIPSTAEAGGVICTAVEYHGGNQAQALQAIDEKIRANTEEVLVNSKKSGAPRVKPPLKSLKSKCVGGAIASRSL